LGGAFPSTPLLRLADSATRQPSVGIRAKLVSLALVDDGDDRTLLIAAADSPHGALREGHGPNCRIAIRLSTIFYPVFLATLVLTGGSLLRDQFSGSGPRHFFG